jgi:hypothetical protein
MRLPLHQVMVYGRGESPARQWPVLTTVTSAGVVSLNIQNNRSLKAPTQMEWNFSRFRTYIYLNYYSFSFFLATLNFQMEKLSQICHKDILKYMYCLNNILGRSIWENILETEAIRQRSLIVQWTICTLYQSQVLKKRFLNKASG